MITAMNIHVASQAGNLLNNGKAVGF